MSKTDQLTCLFVLKGSALNRGMNTGLENLAWGLAERGVIVHILAGGDEPSSHGYQLHSNVHYRFTGKSGDNPISLVPAFQEIVQAHKIDTVIGWIADIASLAAVSKDSAISFIANQGQTPPRSILLRFLKRALFRQMGFVDALKLIASIYAFPDRCKAVVSNSQAVQNATIPAYRLKTGKCRVIRRGIDTDIYRFERKTPQNGRFRVMFAGNVHEPKGVSDLVSALEFISTPITLTLCGKGDQSYINSLHERVRSWNLGHMLVYAGVQNQAQLVKHYNDCDVFAFPSHSEGMPKALLEAMSCGCPVICSDIEPHQEVIQNDNNGLMVPVKSPRNLADGLLKYIENPALRDTCSLHARKTIEEGFSKRHELDNWLALLL